MARFLLVHGASHGAWCWSRVIPVLEDMGHMAKAVDLPGHGNVTLNDYRGAALAHLSPGAIVVGHSLGGLTVTLAAAARPADVHALVYLAAVVPAPGDRFVDIRPRAISPDVSKVTERVGAHSFVKADEASDVFYSDCAPSDVQFAKENLVPQPVSVMQEQLQFEPTEVPRHYIRCLTDRVVLPEYQKQVTADWPADTVHELHTGHSPFFSDPVGLCRHLDAIATAQIRKA